MASPDGRPSLFRITLTDKHFASGRKNSFISFSVALKGNPDIFRLNSLLTLQLLLENVAGAVSSVKLMYLDGKQGKALDIFCASKCDEQYLF